MPNGPIVNELSLPRWLASAARAFYGLGLIGIGMQHFIFREFIPVIVALWPTGIPGRLVGAFVMGALLIAAGGAILFGIRARAVAAVTGVVLLALVVFDDVPSVLMLYPKHIGSWTNAFKALALCGGAWVVAESLEGGRVARWLEQLMPVGRYFLPIMVIVFGVDHFLYAAFVATIVPRWAPGGAMFWTYFAGIALIASGLGIITGILRRLAALMLGIMIFLWVWMLHVPRALADPRGNLGNEWTSVFEALAFSGIAFLLALAPWPVTRKKLIHRSDSLDVSAAR